MADRDGRRRAPSTRRPYASGATAGVTQAIEIMGVLISRTEETSSFGPNQGIFPPPFNAGVVVPANNPFNPFHAPLQVQSLALNEFGLLNTDTTITTFREIIGGTVQLSHGWFIDANFLWRSLLKRRRQAMTKKGKKSSAKRPLQVLRKDLAGDSANTTISFGINNIFDTAPPLAVDNVSGFPSNFDTASGVNYYQRFFWFSVDKKF